MDYIRSQSARTADRWLVLVIIGIAMLWLPEILTRPLFGDDSFYLWAAKQIANGVYPIRDFYCIDTVGVLAYFSALYALGCDNSLAYWAMVAGNVIATSWLLGILTRRLTGSFTSGMWAGFIFTIIQFRCTPAQCLVGKDMLAFPFVLGGLLLAEKRRWGILGHLIVGMGLAVKPTLGAIWAIWILGDLVLARNQFGKWFLKACVSTILVGIPFFVVTLWAEQHGWGWAALKVNTGLAKGFGNLFCIEALYNLTNVFAPVLWTLPFSVLAARRLLPFSLSRDLILMALFVGGLINWLIQPMVSTWYFVPFISVFLVLAAIGVDRIVTGKVEQIVAFAGIGLFLAFVPSTNLRWIKLLGNIGGKEKYSLVEHQSRLMNQSGMRNTPPFIQDWVRYEVTKIVPQGGRVGIIVTDGNLLWALRDYRPGFWAVWCPSWNPGKLTEGLNAGTADVVVGVQTQMKGRGSAIYYDRVAQLQWQMPEAAAQALARNYEELVSQYGYVIYRRREPNP